MITGLISCQHLLKGTKNKAQLRLRGGVRGSSKSVGYLTWAPLDKCTKCGRNSFTICWSISVKAIDVKLLVGVSRPLHVANKNYNEQLCPKPNTDTRTELKQFTVRLPKQLWTLQHIYTFQFHHSPQRFGSSSSMMKQLSIIHPITDCYLNGKHTSIKPCHGGIFLFSPPRDTSVWMKG